MITDEPTRRPPDGPPPPPTQRPTLPAERPVPRLRATVWVAALGATLLLAAAGTFLAVSWDALGLTARVAVVGAATGAAIVGGHRLRGPLPVVGGVVFHLGALLLPVDVLGLALQLEASSAIRWAAVGLTASLLLPPLAVAGRSRTLGLVGLAGVPVTATAAGAAGWGNPAVIVVALAALALALPDGLPSALGPAARLAAPGLATTAVVVPFVLALIVTVPGTGGVGASAVVAGWIGDGAAIAGVGAVAVATLVVAAIRRNRQALTGLTIAVAVLTIVHSTLPVDTPRAVQLLAPAVVALLVQLAALAARRDPLWARSTRVSARVLEVLGLVLASGVLLHLIDMAWWSVGTNDPALAGAYAVAAAAWLLAGLRRMVATSRPSWVGALVVGAWGMAALYAAAALGASPVRIQTVAIGLLAAATVTLITRVDAASDPTGSGAGRPVWDTLTSPAARAAAVVVTGVLALLAGALVVDHPELLLVALTLPAVMGLQLDGLLVERTPVRIAGAVTGSLMTLVTSAVFAIHAASVTGLPRGSGGIAVIVAALLLAAGTDRLPSLADATRGLAAVVGLLAVFTLWPTTGLDGAVHPPTELAAALRLDVVPGALVPSLLAGAWLAVDAVRHARPWIAAMAGPVLVRAVAAGLLAVGVSVPIVGFIVLLLGLAAALATAISSRWLPALPTAVLSVPVGIALLGDRPLLHAAVLIVVGLATVGAGALRSQFVLAHLGGIVATVGVWRLLTVLEVTAIDAWLLPVAAHLAIAGWGVRRAQPTSSWLAYVPSVLLVGVPGLIERAAGGPGWHAVLAGAVAIVAVAAGGLARLGGPLVAGSGVLVAAVVVETFAVVAVVPTWVWLAIGGLVLLGAAAAIERADGSPTHLARRVARVATDRRAEPSAR